MEMRDYVDRVITSVEDEGCNKRGYGGYVGGYGRFGCVVIWASCGNAKTKCYTQPIV